MLDPLTPEGGTVGWPELSITNDQPVLCNFQQVLDVTQSTTLQWKPGISHIPYCLMQVINVLI